MLIKINNDNDFRKKSRMRNWSLSDWQIISTLSKISRRRLRTRTFHDLWISAVLRESNLFKFKTGLPYDLWIDDSGAERQVQHNEPRLKVKVNNDLIPVSIKDTPMILADKKIPKFGKVSSWIKNKRSVLMQYWNKEIDKEKAIKLLYRKQRVLFTKEIIATTGDSVEIDFDDKNFTFNSKVSLDK